MPRPSAPRPPRRGSSSGRPPTGRPQRPQRDRPERDRGERPDRSGRPERGGRPERPGRPERGRPERGERGDRPAASRRQRAADRTSETGDARTKKWGGVARRSAAKNSETTASAAWRAAGDAVRRDREREESRSPQARSDEQWIDEGAVRDEAAEAVGRGRSRPSSSSRRREAAIRSGSPSERPGEVEDDAGSRPERKRESDLDADLSKAVGSKRAASSVKRMREASQSFRRGRYDEARRLLRPLAESAPQVATIRELYGLSLYRLGRWKEAARELEAFRNLTGTVEQHPVLADCCRALRRFAEVEELWDELRAVSPSAALVAEGRIVTAGALADQGKLDDAIRLLEPGVKDTKKAKPHHLRMAYALADIYERAGDLPRARELFERVAASDDDFVDVQARLSSLS